MSMPAGKLFYSKRQAGYQREQKRERMMAKLYRDGRVVEYTEMIDPIALEDRPDAVDTYFAEWPDGIYLGEGVFLRWE